MSRRLTPGWWVVFAVCALSAALLVLGGCTKARTESATTKRDDVTVTGTFTVPTADGPKAFPVALRVNRRGSEATESETRTGIDGEALGAQIAAAITAALGAAGGGGMSLTSLLNAGGALATTAGVAYLAHKKRQQLKPTKEKPS